MNAVGGFLATLLMLYFLVLMGRLVLDYVQLFARSWEPRGAMLVVAEGIYTVTDPPLKLLRRVIPPLRIGGIQLDLSFMVLILLISLAISLANAL